MTRKFWKSSNQKLINPDFSIIPDSEVRINYIKMRDRALDHIAPLFNNPQDSLKLLEKLPIVHTEENFQNWIILEIPRWAEWTVPQDLGGFFLPNFSESQSYKDYPWWRAIIFFIDMEYEKSHRDLFGSTSSYSKFIGKHSQNAYDYAWVNRIAAFLKAWCSHEKSTSIEQLFGSINTPKISLTHDVDAIRITPKLRLTQGIQRFLARDLLNALRILFSRNHFDFLNYTLDLDSVFGFKSTWFFYSGTAKSVKIRKHFLDPNYSLSDELLQNLFLKLKKRGNVIGLHASFSSWQNSEILNNERQQLEFKIRQFVLLIRQHWLRLNLLSTWSAQRTAGFLVDFTLGFNDRVGFRASTALPIKSKFEPLVCITTVIMDSNLFESRSMSKSYRELMIDKILDELETFGGHVSINWHPHTLSSAYDWKETYIYLLCSIKKRNIEVIA